jgi:hypothetical protein
MKLRRLVARVALVAAASMVGCTAYSPGSLPERSSIADARARLGTPSGEYALAGGAKRLEYARGPFGLHTYMLDFDAAGTLRSWYQVLYEENFATIRPGMTSEQVLVAIGHPGHRFGVWSGQQTMWAYRFDSPACVWFLVGVDPAGQVASTQYGPDPRCEATSKGARD